MRNLSVGRVYYDGSSTMADRPLALVTGASAGIGYELAVQCAKNGFEPAEAKHRGAIDPNVDVAEPLNRDISQRIG